MEKDIDKNELLYNFALKLYDQLVILNDEEFECLSRCNTGAEFDDRGDIDPDIIEYYVKGRVLCYSSSGGMIAGKDLEPKFNVDFDYLKELLKKLKEKYPSKYENLKGYYSDLGLNNKKDDPDSDDDFDID